MRNKKQMILNDLGKVMDEAKIKLTDCTDKFEGDMNVFKLYLKYQPMKTVINRAIAFSLLLLFIFAWPVWGATYYVKNGGNDALDGLSDSTAWATIAKVKAMVRSGDTVYFRSQDTWSGALPVLTAAAGVTYDGSTYGTGTRATLQATTSSGSYGYVELPQSNVIFRGFNVDGNKQSCYGGLTIGYHATANISNITVDNCVVHDVGNPTQDNWMYGIFIGPRQGSITVSNIIVTNTTVYNTIHEGIALYPSWQSYNNQIDTTLIRNCTVYNTGLSKDGAGIGILIANHSDNVTVEWCNLYNNHKGIWLRISPITDDSSGNVISGPNNALIRYNLVHDNIYYGIASTNYRAFPMTADIYGNLVYNNGIGKSLCYDMDLGGDESSTTPSKFNIYNNTFYNTTSSCTTKRMVGLATYYKTTSTTVYNLKNNIIYSSDSVPVFDLSGAAIHSNNLIYRSSNESDISVYSTLSKTYNSSGIQTWEPTALNTDPLFNGGTFPTGFTGTYGINMAPNTSYFAITSGKVLDSGITLGSSYNGCINGAGLATSITRPQGKAYDIGAYEYVVPVYAIAQPATPRNLKVQ